MSKLFYTHHIKHFSYPLLLKKILNNSVMAEFWGEIDEDEPLGYIWSAIRGIFDIALLSIVAVFLLHHDSHESELATLVKYKIPPWKCAY
jgi:hypothetical protein